MNVKTYILGRYRHDQTSRNERYRLCCPFCAHSDNKFYIDFSFNFFWCYHCRTKGSLQYFITALHKEISVRDLEFAHTRVIDFKSLADKKRADLPEGFKYISKDIKHDIFTMKYVQYFMSRGFDYEFMIKTRVGFSPVMSSYLIFPVFNEIGEYVYWTSRYIGDGDFEKTMNPKYVEGTYTKNDVLYNINRALHSNTVYLVEGVFDCLSLHALKYNAVASLGKEPSDMQINMLVRMFDNIIVCYDGKALSDTLDAAEKIYNAGKRAHICILPADEKDDPNDLYLNGSIQNYLKNTIEFSKALKIRLLLEARKKSNYFEKRLKKA